MRTNMRAAALAMLAAGMAMGEVEVRVRPTAGGPQIHVNGSAVVPRFFYGSASDSETLGYCRDAGVRFISVAAEFCWPESGDDWSAVDAVFNKVLAVHPSALIVPRIYINAPGWLMTQHPEWKMVFKSGKDYGNYASIFAHDFRTLAAAQLEKQVRHLREKYPDNFAGVHFTGQSYGEFFYLESLGGDLHGYETPVRDSWREWLAAQGEADAATAEIPTDAERLARTNGLIRDGNAERRMVLFNRFEQEELADFVAAMAAAARTGSDEKSLVMCFHGYGFEHTTVPNGPATTGDYGSEYLLTKAAGNIDIICAPFSYVNRLYLAPTMTQTAAESITLRGVMALDEDDTRTYLVKTLNDLSLAGNWARPTKAQTLRQMRSNLTACITRGRACWWMDLVSEKWYADRDIWRVMEDMRPFDASMLNRKAPFEPEIALTIDEEGMMYATAGSSVAFKPMLKESREWFEKCGTAYGQYYSSDALAGKLKAKLQFFFSSFYADATKRAAVAAQRTQQPGVTRVWCWAPGWVSENGLSVDNIRQVTGFTATRKSAAIPEVTATAAGKALGFPDSWNGTWSVDPLFSVAASGDEVLATWPDGTAAVAARKSGSGYEVFYGVPAFTTEVIAGLAKLAGCAAHATPGKAYVREAEGKAYVEPLAVNWPIEKLKVAPERFDASKYATNDVEVLFYQGMPYKGKETRVFAYFGMPEHAEGTKVPAMVLVHGGGGSAFYRWVKFWNSKGYAAIAMDTCGKISGNTIGQEQFGHYAHEWSGPSGWGSFWSMGDADEDQWIFHAICDAILANSFLRAQTDIDPDRIGITGVSWGGIITCIAASLDDRFKFAAPVYGCGANFVRSPAWKENCATLGAEWVPVWREKWDPENYLPRATTPFHWLVGTNDSWFSLPAVEDSREAVSGDESATFRVRMVHTHGKVSEEAAEIVQLAEHYLKDGAALPKLGEVTIADGVASASVSADSALPVTGAVLDYTTDEPDAEGMWYSRNWQSAEATVANGKVTAVLPEGTKAFYLNVETADGMRVSSHVSNYDGMRPRYVLMNEVERGGTHGGTSGADGSGETREMLIEYEMPEKGTFVPTLEIQTNVSGDVWAKVDDRAIARMTGDVNRKVTAARGVIRCLPECELPNDPKKVRAIVTTWPMDNPPDYMVVSLAEGAKDADSRVRYYVSTNAMPGGLLENVEYRTTSMVFKKVLAKGVTWKMGSDVNNEPAGKGYTNEGQHEVTMERNYYLGVFPLTQTQFATLQGYRSGSWFILESALRAQDALCYSSLSPSTMDARGSNYPDAPHANSILGKMRARLGGTIDFDLPSEAEWEFACRAGYGDNYWNDGTQMKMTYASRSTDEGLDRLGRYRGNNATQWYENWKSVRDLAQYMGLTNGIPNVGTYAPNAWGFYDMLGCLNEWCLDWYQADVTKLGGAVNVDADDPTKALDGTTCYSYVDGAKYARRVLRGGNYHDVAFVCRPACRYSCDQWYHADACENGMRVKCYMGLRK